MPNLVYAPLAMGWEVRCQQPRVTGKSFVYLVACFLYFPFNTHIFTYGVCGKIYSGQRGGIVFGYSADANDARNDIIFL